MFDRASYFFSLALATAFSTMLTATLTTPAGATIEALTISTDDAISAPRWMFGKGEAPTGDSTWALLAQAKHAQLDGDGETCLKKIDQAWAKAKTVQPWLALVELDCATKLKAGAERVHKAIARVEKNPAWLLTGAQTDSLRTELVKAYMAQI